jgi:hypothetical protein
MGDIEWVPVPGLDGRSIGAVGFIGNQAVVVAAFYDDYDGNRDGEVDWLEWAASKVSPLSLDGAAVVEVAMAARVMPAVVLRDGAFDTWAKQAFVQFAGGLVVEAVYAAYFSHAIRLASGGIASAIGGGLVREYVIRKGMEAAVKSAYDAAVLTSVSQPP